MPYNQACVSFTWIPRAFLIEWANMFLIYNKTAKVIDGGNNIQNLISIFSVMSFVSVKYGFHFIWQTIVFMKFVRSLPQCLLWISFTPS